MIPAGLKQRVHDLLGPRGYLDRAEDLALYEYDGGGIGDSLVTSATDALGQVTTYDYDFRHRKTTVTLPDPLPAGQPALSLGAAGRGRRR